VRTFTQGDRIRVQRSPSEIPYLIEDQPVVYGIGPDKDEIRIAIIGSHPTASDANSQTPFTGQPGKFLWAALAQAGLDPRGMYLDNVIDREPPAREGMKSIEAKEAVKAQTPAFLEILRWLVDHNVQVVVALGEHASEAFGIKGSLSSVRGSIYEYNLDWPGPVTDPVGEPCHFVVIPTYHLGFNPGSRFVGRGKERADNFSIWVADLKKAKEIADNGYTRPKEDFIWNPTRDQVVEFLDDVIDNQLLTAIDIETAGFNPRADAIVCIGFATSGERGICVPLYRTGSGVSPRTPYWHPSDRSIIEAKIREVLTSAPQMYQNALFDVNFLQEAGYDVNLDMVKHDTLLLHHSVNPELPHKLGFITSTYGSTPYWKEDFSKRDFSIWEMEPRDLQIYNIRDCVVLHQVLTPLLEDLEETGTGAAYEESMDIVPPVLEMMQTGLKLSVSRLKKFKEQVLHDIEQLRRQLFELGNLPEAFNLSSTDDVRLFLFGVVARKYDAAADWDKHKPGTKIREKKRLIYEVKEKTKCPVDHKYQGRGGMSVDKDGRSGLLIHCLNRIQQIKGFKRPTPEHESELAGLERLVEWLGLYSEWSRLRKLESTYTSFPMREDGRVHTRYVIHGTVTGRLSSRDPNLQNLPKSEKRVRSCFIAPSNWKIVSADYSSLEFGTVAYETGDPTMIEAFESGVSQHDVNTRALFGIDKDDPKWDAARAAAKTFQFATQYGGGLYGVYEKIQQQVPELELTWATFNEAVENLYSKLNKYGEWRTRIQAEAVQTRKVWSAFGRCRLLYGNESDIGREALNFPCQSAAAHIINKATRRIYDRFHEEGLLARLQAQTHDQLYVECPAKEVQVVMEIMQEEMERPLQFYDRTVTFPVDFEVGDSWGTLEHL
jgi:uracil-DNA glycosylase family 4